MCASHGWDTTPPGLTEVVGRARRKDKSSLVGIAVALGAECRWPHGRCESAAGGVPSA